MREGRPSFTATVVSTARIAGPDGVDPVEGDLLSPGAASLARMSRKLPRIVSSVASLGLTDHIRLRTRAIDDALLEAAPFTEQMVILGAGLDTRAFRLPALSHVAAFEVDHPSTQQHKRAGLGDRAPTTRSLAFVAVDFQHDDLATLLARAGHDAGRTTFWIWEGVTMYLPRPALRATLDVIGARSAKRSRVALTYVTHALSSYGKLADRVAARAFDALGESLLGMIEEAELSAELEARGFCTLADEDTPARARRLEPRVRSLSPIRERIRIAEKR